VDAVADPGGVQHGFDGGDGLGHGIGVLGVENQERGGRLGSGNSHAITEFLRDVGRRDFVRKRQFNFLNGST
jgi:hypothetical protein